MKSQCKKVGGFYVYTDRKLGRGKSGDVCLAERVEDKEMLACKVLKNVADESGQGVDVMKELHIHRRITHPNVLKYKGHAITRNHIYIFTELCEQGSMDKFIKERGDSLGLKEALRLLYQIADACLYLSIQGIIHRDIKPDNILMKDGNIQLADFGFSTCKNLAESTLGTPLYMSPQILTAEIYSCKTDVWSAGIILYNLVFRSHPFNTKTGHTGLRASIISRLRTGFLQYSEPQKRMSKKQPELMALLRSMLALNECDRLSWEQVLQHRVFQKYELRRQRIEWSILSQASVDSKEVASSVDYAVQMDRRVKWLEHLHNVVNKAYQLSYKAQDVVIKDSKFLNYGLLYLSSCFWWRQVTEVSAYYEEARPRLKACAQLDAALLKNSSQALQCKQSLAAFVRKYKYFQKQMPWILEDDPEFDAASVLSKYQGLQTCQDAGFLRALLYTRLTRELKALFLSEESAAATIQQIQTLTLQQLVVRLKPST